MRRYLGSIGGGLFAMVQLASAALAGPPDLEDVSARLYLQHCSSCHGSEGGGDGALAVVLNVTPADLTQLAKENGGAFPYPAVFRAIDGREATRAHGNSAMPVWGDVFRPDPSAPPSEQLAGPGKIMLITLGKVCPT